jgi:hypothetical protein
MGMTGAAALKFGSTGTPSSTELVDWLVRDLTGESHLDPVLAVTARYAIFRLGAALGVLDCEAADPMPTETFPYTSTVIREAVEAAARQLTVGMPRPSDWALRYAAPADAGTSLRNAAAVLVLDLNHASEAQLAAVDGLGHTTAARLLAARRDELFSSLDEARRRAEIDADAWRRAAPFLGIYPFDPAPAVPVLGDRPLQGLIHSLQAGTVVWPALVPSGRPHQDAVSALRLCCQRAATPPNVPSFWAPSPARLQAGMRAVRGRSPESDEAVSGGVALVRNAAYPQLLDELLAGATESIRVSMFFIALGSSQPIRRVVDAVVAARDRGVDVKVVLGDDLPGDPHGAALVNREARVALGQAHVQVRPSWLEVALHEKAVVIDARRVLVGSQNWTASSFYQYDETSLFLDSAELGEQLARRFDDRWVMLDPDRTGRRIPIAALELAAPAAPALARAGIQDGADLDLDASAIARLSADSGLTAERLILIGRVASLMLELRIAELTAATFVVAGLDTATKVRDATNQERRDALERPAAEPPEPFARRRVFPAVADLLGGV